MEVCVSDIDGLGSRQNRGQLLREFAEMEEDEEDEDEDAASVDAGRKRAVEAGKHRYLHPLQQ